jgi:hypothetical protein
MSAPEGPGGEPGAGGTDDSQSAGNEDIDADLDRALKDFDGQIMNERREVAERANESAGENPIDDPAAGDNGADGRRMPGDIGDIDPGDGGDMPSGGGETQSGDPSIAKGGKGTSGAGGAMPDIDIDSASPPPPPPLASADPKKGDLPEDVADAKDDDVVARQLREAAMAEPDPVLREKLWEEYRRYKEGR